MRILNVEPLRYDESARELLCSAGETDFVECRDQQAFLRTLASAPYEALFVRLGLSVDAAALAKAPRLRWVVTPTTGLDHLDVPLLEQRGVRVISLRGQTAFLDGVRSTAEHTWALLLSLLRGVPAAHEDVLAGQWRREPFLGIELSGKTLGILGCGRLGRMTAGYGLAFGMQVLVFDRSGDALARAPEGVRGRELSEVLGAADVLLLHLSLEESTRGLLSEERLRLIKRGAWLVNTARGELIDEDALLAALKEGRLAGAALDVLAGDGTWDQGVPTLHPLVQYAREHRNLILSPHVGGYGQDSLHKTRRFVARLFCDAAVFRNGEPKCVLS